MEANSFSGKTVVVTGASRGLGRRIAEAFWRCGAGLLLVARSAEALAALCNELGTRAHFLALDLASADAPDEIFTRLSGRPLDVLVNNAAIVGPIGPLDENDWVQWQQTLQLNLLTPAALTRLAVQRMKPQGAGVILNISGGGATSARPHFSAYATAKAGLVRLTETIAAENARYGIRVNAIAPGPMNTEMHDAVLRAGPARAGAGEYRKALEQVESGGTALSVPAELAVFLASDAAAQVNGRLISAVWDPWRELAGYAAEVAQSDVYTLRRIVPKDRGFDWPLK